MTNEYERFQQRLEAAGIDDADELAQVAHLLQGAPTANVRSQHKQQLLTLMQTHLPQPKTRLQRVMEWYPVAVLQSQIRVIRSEIWLASAFVMLLGLLLTVLQPYDGGLTFRALAPLVAAAGVALLYDENIRIALELEHSTRASGRMLLLARLTLVFGFDLALALSSSVIMALLNAEISLLPLIASWLAPMAFLSGLAFFLSVLLVDTLAAAVFSMFLWLLHLLFTNIPDTGQLSYLLSLPGLADPTNRPFLFATAALLVLVALWLLDIEKRPLGQSS